MKTKIGWLTLLIALFTFSSFGTSVHASDDLSGHAYTITTKSKFDDGTTGSSYKQYIIFGNNGQAFVGGSNTVKYLLKHKNLIDNFIESQNNYREKETHNYTLNGNQLSITTNDGTVIANTTIDNGSKINKSINNDDGHKEIVKFSEVK